MELSIKFCAIKSGWSIKYIQGPQVKISKQYCFSISEYRFYFINSVDPDEMLHYHVAFHLGLHCLPKYPGSNDKNYDMAKTKSILQ